MTVTGYIILSLVFLAIWFINRPEKEKTMKDVKSPDIEKMYRKSSREVSNMFRRSSAELNKVYEDSLNKLKGEIE